MWLQLISTFHALPMNPLFFHRFNNIGLGYPPRSVKLFYGAFASWSPRLPTDDFRLGLPLVASSGRSPWPALYFRAGGLGINVNLGLVYTSHSTRLIS